MSFQMISRNRLLSCLILIFAVQFGHFTRLQEFGLWEDDYWSIAPNLDEPIQGLGTLLVHHLETWPTGRPLNHFLPAALAIIGSKLGGLSGVYILAMVWLDLNACLVLVILRRFVPPGAALCGGLAYVLFPADTTKILLVHAAHIQGAMTFLLAGTLLWLKGGTWRWMGYGVAGLSLLAYETAFLPFLAAPFLFAGDKRSTLRVWCMHIIVCTAVIATVAAIRFHTGDVRAAAAVGSLSETVHRILTSLYLGPATSIAAFFRGAGMGFKHLNAPGAVSALLVGASIVVFWAQRSEDKAESGRRLDGNLWPVWLNQPVYPFERLPWWWLAIVGLAMWSTSYGLSIVNYPPTQFVGRFTSTHVAAAWPASIVLAALSCAAYRLTTVYRRALIVGGIGLTLLLVGYHNFLQSEYIRAWHIQKLFWREVLAEAPEAGSGWTIIVTGPPCERPAVIAANSWADYHVCRLLLDGNKTGTGTAFAHLGYLGPVIKFRRAEGVFTWQPQFWTDEYVPIDPAHLILLESDGVSLRRISKIATSVGSLESTVPIPHSSRNKWPSTPLAHLFFPDRYSNKL